MPIMFNIFLSYLSYCVFIIYILLSITSCLHTEFPDLKTCQTNFNNKNHFYKQLCADFGSILAVQAVQHEGKSACRSSMPIRKTEPQRSSDSYNIVNFNEDVMIEHGGWLTKKDRNEAQPGPCTIEKVLKSDLSQQKFLKEYAFNKPVIIYGASNNKAFKYLTQYNFLLENYGNTTIHLSSANSYSYDKRTITFKEYCERYLETQSLKTLGNETFYFFGDNSNEDWYDLIAHYNHPPYFLPGHSAQLSFGVAGPGSGVPFHFHGPGFAETLWGRKRWFMYSPDMTPPFHPNRTTLQWLNEDYLNLQNDPHLSECTLDPGEFIYFPNQWWHATLNIDTTVFMSTFLSP